MVSYFRSRLIYYMTPLVAAGINAEWEVEMIEADLKRNVLRIPKCTRSSIIQTTTGWGC